MTTALTMLAGALLGSATATSVLVARFARRLQEAGWRADTEPATGELPLDPVELRVARARALRAEALAHQRERTIGALQQLHRYVIADLLDAIVDRDDALQALQGTSPVPDYGSHRAVAS